MQTANLHEELKGLAKKHEVSREQWKHWRLVKDREDYLEGKLAVALIAYTCSCGKPKTPNSYECDSCRWYHHGLRDYASLDEK